MTVDKEHQAVTRGIKHWGLSGYSSVLPRTKFGVTGQESSPQSPTISYRHPLLASLKDDATRNGRLAMMQQLRFVFPFIMVRFGIIALGILLTKSLRINVKPIHWKLRPLFHLAYLMVTFLLTRYMDLAVVDT